VKLNAGRYKCHDHSLNKVKQQDRREKYMYKHSLHSDKGTDSRLVFGRCSVRISVTTPTVLRFFVDFLTHQRQILGHYFN
jgi:hypothetical protein